MIVYDLVCKHRHGFEGWFSSNEDFQRQREAKLIRCPLCDDAAIARRPSAQVRVGRAAQPKEDKDIKKVDAQSQKPAEVALGGDADVLKMMRRLVADTENVGRAFAEEARKIHYGETPERHIYGEATHKEAQELLEEGVDVSPLPPDTDNAN